MPGVEVAGVQPLDRVQARVGAQRRRELAVADVDRPDLGGAGREQHLAEAAGRGAEVEGDRALRVEPEDVEGVAELQPAARDVRQRVPLDGERRAWADPRRRLRHAHAVDPDGARRDQRLRPRPAVGEPGRHQRLVEPPGHVPSFASRAGVKARAATARHARLGLDAGPTRSPTIGKAP